MAGAASMRGELNATSSCPYFPSTGSGLVTGSGLDLVMSWVALLPLIMVAFVGAGMAIGALRRGGSNEFRQRLPMMLAVLAMGVATSAAVAIMLREPAWGSVALVAIPLASIGLSVVFLMGIARGFEAAPGLRYMLAAVVLWSIALNVFVIVIRA